jgi:hypothetical protein
VRDHSCGKAPNRVAIHGNQKHAVVLSNLGKRVMQGMFAVAWQAAQPLKWIEGYQVILKFVE